MNNLQFYRSKFKSANILSIVLFLTSILFIIFKGLNYGIDFKGGTLIEVKDLKNISSFRNKRCS